MDKSNNISISLLPGVINEMIMSYIIYYTYDNVDLYIYLKKWYVWKEPVSLPCMFPDDGKRWSRSAIKRASRFARYYRINNLTGQRFYYHKVCDCKKCKYEFLP